MFGFSNSNKPAPADDATQIDLTLLKHVGLFHDRERARRAGRASTQLDDAVTLITQVNDCLARALANNDCALPGLCCMYEGQGFAGASGLACAHIDVPATLARLGGIKMPQDRYELLLGWILQVGSQVALLQQAKYTDASDVTDAGDLSWLDGEEPEPPPETDEWGNPLGTEYYAPGEEPYTEPNTGWYPERT